ELVAGQRVADQDGVGAILVEPAIGLPADAEGPELDAAIQPQLLPRAEAGPLTGKLRPVAGAGALRGVHRGALHGGGLPPLEKVAAPLAVNVCFLCFCRALRLSLAASRDGPPDMASADNPLDDLRCQIDGIDDALHDLLIRRAEIAERIGKLKSESAGGAPAVFLRPGREAIVLRRL